MVTRVKGLRRSWSLLRYLLGFGLVAVAVWVLWSHSSELAGFSQVLGNLNWWWIAPAIVLELASYICFAGMQYELLRSGHLRAPPWPLLKMSFASQALANSLPGGNAVSSVYGFRWYRRFGADSTLAAWALIGTFVGSMVTLSLVAVLGLAVAADEGASLDLVPVLIGAFVVTVAVGALFVYERPLHSVVGGAVSASRALTGRPRGDATVQIERIMKWMTVVRLGWKSIGRIVLWGTSNWLLDCACFALIFLAIRAPIPWEGLLLAYGAGQLAATLPITPGGLGAVEGSITVALVAFGGAQSTTVDTVLIYRFVSFWFILVIGWAFMGELALQVRAGRWNRRAMASDNEAGPSVFTPALSGVVR
ncbi:MAG TPA: YbhN family protein [Acidimicrobiales bacterium]|nr:YbhN family protein [Acidimicrobiales bacterium]